MASSLNLDLKLFKQDFRNSSSPEHPTDDSFCTSLAKRAKSTLLEDGRLVDTSWETKAQPLHEQCSPVSKDHPAALTSNGRWKGQDTLDLHKGLQAIATSLSLLSDTLGAALEDGLNLVEARKQFGRAPAKRESDLQFGRAPAKRESATPSPDKLQISPTENLGLTKEIQLKASHDVAMAMATKAKLLLRELKCVKANLTFTRDRCAQLEEENKRLRESLDKGLKHDEDDLVRLQLETLLAEKARLAQENASYARENHFLHEVVQYHQLTLRDVVLLDENLTDASDFGGESPIDSIEFVEEEHPREIDIPTVENSVGELLSSR